MTEMRMRARRALPMVALLLIAAGVLLSGVILSQRQPPQLAHYNQAMAAYQQADVDGAIRLLEQSLADYQEALGSPWWQQALLGRPSQELAALAHFHKGVLLLVKAQAEQRPGLLLQAVDEFHASLEINPGAPYADHVSGRDAARLDAQAMTVKHDLDLLYQQNPELQQGEGEGEEGDGPPQPAKPAPGTTPGSKPGQSEDDGI